MKAHVETFIKSPYLLLVFATFFWASYSILMKKYGASLPKKSTFIITMYIGILILLPFAMFERTYNPISLSSLSLEAIIGVVYLGIFPSIISFICWNEGVMRVGPGKASNFLHLIVLFTCFVYDDFSCHYWERSFRNYTANWRIFYFIRGYCCFKCKIST